MKKTPALHKLVFIKFTFRYTVANKKHNLKKTPHCICNVIIYVCENRMKRSVLRLFCFQVRRKEELSLDKGCHNFLNSVAKIFLRDPS